MSYRKDSEWNDKNELKCLIIFKKLEKENFPRGGQIFYCREIAQNTKLSVGNISAKVGNFKSIAGINKKSNASKNTKEIYDKYCNYSINEIEEKLKILD
jgi:hypothetical protein